MERRVYHYLIDFLSQNTYQPSIREIARAFHIKSTKTVSDLLGALADKGYVERFSARSRGVRLIGLASPARVQPVPLFARINPGEPPLLESHRESYVTMDRRYLPGEDVFLIRAHDDNMASQGIMDGDLVLVSPSARAADGDLVVRRDGTEARVSVHHTHGGHAVLGVVCGVFRPFHEQEPDAPGVPASGDAG